MTPPSTSTSVAPTLAAVLLAGVVALAVPAWLAYDNPSGIEMAGGVAVHAPDAPGSKVRGRSYVGGWVAHDRLDPEAGPRTRPLRVGVTPLCLDGAEEVELTGVRAIPESGTPRPGVRGMVRRLAPGSYGSDGGTVEVGITWDPVPPPGERYSADRMLGMWHELEGERVTGQCVDGEADVFRTGGEEVVAVVDVDARGVDVDRFEVDVQVDGRPHRLVVDADLTVCGTQVSDPHCPPDVVTPGEDRGQNG